MAGARCKNNTSRRAAAVQMLVVMNHPTVIFSPAVDYVLGWTLLHTLWQFTLIAVLAGLVLLALNRRSARARYWTGYAAMLLLLATAAADLVYFARQAPLEPGFIVPELEAGLLEAGAPADSIPAGAAGWIEAAQREAADRAAAQWDASRWATPMGAYFHRHLPLVVLVWMMGMVASLFKVMGNLSYVYYLRQRMNFSADPYWVELLERLSARAGWRKSIALMESALVRSPLTLGFLKPVILFPIGYINKLSEAEVEAILAHELAHIVRRDYLVNLLQSFIESLFYYHPAVWWLSAQVRNERESACDEMAIALLGDKLSYAKALVAIQEMSFYPQGMALGMGGQRQGQLMYRMQRLFSHQKFSLNNMEKWIITAVTAIGIVLLAFGQRIPAAVGIAPAEAHAGPAVGTSGVWEAQFGPDSVCLTLASRMPEGGSWVSSDCYLLSAFTALNPAPGEVSFEMKRPAGVLQFRGRIEADKTGYGRYEFKGADDFRRALTRQGISEADDELLLHCFFADFGADYVANVKRQGIADIGKEELMELAVFRISEAQVGEYLDLGKQLGKPSLEVADLIEFNVSGVTPQQVRAYARAGYDDLSLDNIMAFSIHGLDPEYIQALNNAGFGRLSADDMLAAKIHDITPEFVREAREASRDRNLDFDDVLAMKIHGVDAEFIAAAVAEGLAEGDDLDELMALKIHGIDAAFVAQCSQLGLGELDNEQVMAAKIHDITPEFVAGIRRQGFSDLDFDEVVSFRIFDVNPEALGAMRALDLGDLDAEAAVALSMHDVDAAYVRSLRNAGIRNLDVESVVAAKIHGIDEAFIREAERQGHRSPDIEDYIELRVMGRIK